MVDIAITLVQSSNFFLETDALWGLYKDYTYRQMIEDINRCID